MQSTNAFCLQKVQIYDASDGQLFANNKNERKSIAAKTITKRRYGCAVCGDQVKRLRKAGNVRRAGQTDE